MSAPTETTAVVIPPADQQIGLTTVDVACAYLSISRETFFLMQRRGEIETVLLRGSVRRISWRELHRLAGEPKPAATTASAVI
jgi:hypothetical protein